MIFLVARYVEDFITSLLDKAHMVWDVESYWGRQRLPRDHQQADDAEDEVLSVLSVNCGANLGCDCRPLEGTSDCVAVARNRGKRSTVTPDKVMNNICCICFFPLSSHGGPYSR